MSSRFSLQKPYIIASLPQPIDRTNGRYVVGEVIGGGVGTKKRKRSELVVGIDGEGLSLYDISSSKLITSYALPPQSTFTCSPASVRSRISKTTVERRTYVSTKEPQPRITLFREITTGLSTEPSTATQSMISASAPIVHLGTITAGTSNTGGSAVDLLTVHEDGEIQCFDGESLQKKWSSPASALTRDSSNLSELRVEFAQLTTAYTASQGILKGRQDVFAHYPQEISAEGFNPEILIVITRCTQEESTIRTLHILSLPKRASTQSMGLQQSVDSLLTAEIPSRSLADNHAAHASFILHVASGTLQQLQNELLTTFDLTNTIPKEQSRLFAGSGQSFLRLSSTSVLISSPTSVTVYNPKYQSILATTELDTISNPENRKRKRESLEDLNPNLSQCKFIAYFPRLAIATAILGSKLIGIQVEGQQDRQGRLHAAGLLIDSIGRSASGHLRPTIHNGTTKVDGMSTLGSFLPTALGHDVPWASQIKQIEKLFQTGECDEAMFDSKIAKHLSIDVGDDTEDSAVDGIREGSYDPDAKVKASQHLSPSNVDRRWIIYALGKIFKLNVDDADENSLSISFYPPKTFMWLISNGFMTVANIEAGLRKAGSAQTSFLAGSLVDLIVDADEDMDLLLVLIAKNYLSAEELLHAIRHLIQVLAPPKEQGLLTNGEDHEMTNGGDLEMTNGDFEEQYQRLEAVIDAELELVEYRLGNGSDTQGHALTLALSKLYTRPSSDIVQALQTTYTSQEIVSLIELLRYELMRGGWTDKHIQTSSNGSFEIPNDSDEEDGPEDSAIVVIAGLMNNCIDAVGAGGWLSGDAKFVHGDPYGVGDLISGLKVEISTALESIEEAAYLKGLTSEMIRYGEAVEASRIGSSTNSQAPVILPTGGESNMLPVGLKVEKPIPLSKVGAGGALYKRTKRDIGYLKSQKIGKYSRERIRL